MLVVDASCLFAVVADTPDPEPVRERMTLDQDRAAPHGVDVELLGVICRDLLLGRLDMTAVSQGWTTFTAGPASGTDTVRSGHARGRHGTGSALGTRCTRHSPRRWADLS
jgi:hypothetical protein